MPLTRFGSKPRSRKMSHSSVFPGGPISEFLILIHSSLKLAYVHASRLNLGHGASNVPQSPPAVPAERWPASYGTGQALPCPTKVDHSDPIPCPLAHTRFASSDFVKACLFLSPKSGLHMVVCPQWPQDFQSTLQAPTASAMSVPNQEALVPELYPMMRKGFSQAISPFLGLSICSAQLKFSRIQFQNECDE
jgi:hypothetical protein